MLQQIVKDSKGKKRVITIVSACQFRNEHGQVVVVAKVRDDKGVEYFVKVWRGSVRSKCSCPSWGACYHAQGVLMVVNVIGDEEHGLLVHDEVDEPAREGVYAERLAIWARNNAQDAYEKLAETKQVSNVPCGHKDSRCTQKQCFWVPDYSQL